MQDENGTLLSNKGFQCVITSYSIHYTKLYDTGETFPVEKKVGAVGADANLAARTNCVFMGTNVRSGRAKGLIVQTGEKTAFGEIADSLKLRLPKTEFERGVRRFGLMLAEMMLVMVVLVFAFNVYFHKPILDSLLFSIALVV